MYECSHCKTRYSNDEFRTLPAESRVTDDPTDEYGIENVCPECGNRFFSDKWQLIDEVTVAVPDDELDVVVSTVHLIIPHGPQQNQWYETLLKQKYGNRIVDRYMTQDEAEEGHQTMCERLDRGRFELTETPMAKELRLP